MKKLAIFLVFTGAFTFGYAQQNEVTLEELYAKANERLQEGAYKNAVIDYNQLVNSNFTDGKIYLNRGIAHYHLGEYELAGKDFDQAFRQQLRDTRLIGYRGMTKYMLKDYAGASSDLEQAVMQGFADKDALYMLGNIKFQSARYEEAIRNYDLAEEKGLKTAVLYNNRGKAKLELGSADKSIPDFDQAIRTDRDMEMAYRNRAAANIKLEKWENAVQDLEKIIDKGEQEDMFNLGYAFLRLKKYEDAVSNLQRASAKGVDNSQVDPLLAEAYTGSRDFKKAAVYYDKMVRRDASNLEAWEKLGISLYNDEQFVQSEKSLTEAIDRGRSTKETYGYRGMSRYRLSKMDAAFEDLSRVSTMGFTNEDAYYYLGKLLIDKKQYETAIAQLNKGIALNPEKCGALEARSRAYSAMGEVELARTDIKKAIQLQESADLWVTSANIEMTAKNFEKAVQDYEKSVELGAKSPTIYSNQADAYFELGNFSKALEKYKTAFSLNPKLESLHLRIAVCEYRLENFDNAYASFRKAEAVLPIEASYLYSYAYCSFLKKEYAKTVSLLANVKEKGTPVETARMLAVSHFEMSQFEPAAEAAARATQDSEMSRIQGLSLYRLKRVQESIPFLEKTEKTEEIVSILAGAYIDSGNDAAADKYLSWLLENNFVREEYLLARAGIRRKSDEGAALADLNKALSLNPDSKDALLMRSEISINRKEWAIAIKDLEKLDAAGFDPRNTKYLLGISYLETGNKDKGKEALEGALSAGSGEPRMFAELGKFAFSDEQWDRSIDLLTKSIEIKSDNSLLSVRGRAYFQKEQYEKAIQDLKAFDAGSYEELNALGRSYYALDDHVNASLSLSSAFKLKPEENELPFLLGNSYFRVKDYQKAIDSYLKAASNGYSDAVLFNNLGKAYEQNDAIQDAISAYNKAIEIDPEYERARENRGIALYSSGNYAGAIDDLSRISEKDENVNFYLAESYFKTAKYKEALGFYNKSIDGGRKDGLTYHHRARAYLELNQITAALADLNLAIQAGEKDAKVYLDRARANIYMEDERAALADLNEVIARDPENTDAYYNRGYLRELSENYQEAITDYKKVISLDPEDHKAYYSLANSMVSLGNVGGALEPIKEAIRIKSDESSYYKVHGNILYRLERGEEACENWKKAVQLGDKKASFYLDQYCK